MLNTGIDRNVLSKFDDSKRAVANLMARENITVQILPGQPTASFDTVNRILTLPDWPSLTVDQLDTQICHEIGHALFTDNSYIEKVVARRKTIGPVLHTYINVIEDTRIERKMREAFPGVTRIFYNGRKDFAEKGPIFELSGANHVLLDGKKVAIKELSFIDRINCHYKLGAIIEERGSRVPFSPAEARFFPMIEKCFSTDNACEIAEKLYEFAKEQDREQQRQQQQQQSKQKAQSGQAGESGKSQKSDKKDGKKEQKQSKSEKGDAEGDEADDKNEKSSAAQDGDDKDDAAEESGKSDKDGDEEGEESGQSSGDSDDEGDEESQGSGASEGDEDGDESGDSSDDSDSDGSASGDADEGEDEQGGHAEEHTSGGSAPQSSGSPDDGYEVKEPEASATDEAQTKALQKLAEQQKSSHIQIRHVLLKPLDEKVVRERTVTAAEWLKQAEQQATSYHGDALATTKLKEVEEKWNHNFLATAKHMAAEFQRRKTAKNLQHAKTGRTGKLDLSKLAKYKTADDLFKRVTTVPDGQSHGIVMMIDGSSSMQGVFGDVLDQVLLFAHFAFQCNIPFEAYMFTDTTGNHNVKPLGQNTINLAKNGSLIGLVNTVTDRRSFKKQIQYVLAFRAIFDSEYGTVMPSLPYSNLGGTPLYAAMMVFERHVERMKRTLRLDKVMAVVISDGGDTNGLQLETQKADYNGRIVAGFERLPNTGLVVRDVQTKRNHILAVPNTMVPGQYQLSNNAIMTLFFDVMKTRHDARGIYMFLSSGRPEHAVPYLVRAGVSQVKNDDARKNKWNEDGQFVLSPEEGCTDLAFVMRTNSVKLTENLFEKFDPSHIASTARQNVVAEKFRETAATASKNRVFVNSVMPFIA